jgi:hypothetical protein
MRKFAVPLPGAAAAICLYPVDGTETAWTTVGEGIQNGVSAAGTVPLFAAQLFLV